MQYGLRWSKEVSIDWNMNFCKYSSHGVAGEVDRGRESWEGSCHIKELGFHHRNQKGFKQANGVEL